MSQWTPEWSISVNGAGDVTGVTLANLSISSGRTDIYSQPVAGYCTVDILNLEQTAINFDVNDAILIKVKNSSGTFVNLFGGDITDITTAVTNAGTEGVVQVTRIVALGALSKLPKTLTDGVLSKDEDGDQIYTILSQTLFGQWNEVPAAETWAGYEPTIDWLNAENSGLGEIDRPGNYELHARAASTTDIYSLVSALATSGLGYLYEDSQGRIGYADSTHRSSYLATNGYVMLSANNALINGLQTVKRAGDIRNKVTITYKDNAQVTAEDAASIAVYGSQAQIITTSIEKVADATSQANFYLAIRAYPQDIFQSITFSLGNPEIDNADRNSLLSVFMGMPVDIADLPGNMVNGRFQGFVEGWQLRAAYNRLDITLNVSPTAFSLQSMQWADVSAAETWNTITSTLTWNNATIVS